MYLFIVFIYFAESNKLVPFELKYPWEWPEAVTFAKSSWKVNIFILFNKNFTKIVLKETSLKKTNFCIKNLHGSNSTFHAGGN